MRVLILITCMALISCDGVSFTPFATSTRGDGIQLQPCHLKGLAEEVRCGIHEVFENRTAKAGRRLPIHVAVLPALRRLVDPDPLFIFSGGPGQGARGFAGAAARYFRKVRRSRDIVLVDLRGTGASAPLRCPDAADDLALATTAQVRQCAAAIDAEVRHYTHEQSLADVDEIRQRLGYARLNLWGGSWGTRAALLYALRFPEATRSVVLDGAVPLGLGFPRTASADAHAAVSRLIDDCTSNADCAAAFPDPRGLLRALDRRFDGSALTVHIRHPRSGVPVTVTLPRDVVTEIIRGALYVPGDSAALLQVITHAVNGDFAPIVAQYLRTASWSLDEMTLGATLSVLCSEDLPLVAGVDFSVDAKGSYFGTSYADEWRAHCHEWPAGIGLRADVDAVSSAPALILSGEHDPVTPPRTGEDMARHFSSSWRVVVSGAAHNTSFGGCVPDLIAAFIEHGGGDGLDTSCANRVMWPPFVVSNAGSRP